MIYKDYELSNEQISILKYLSKNPTSDLKHFIKSDISFLIDSNFVKENHNQAFFKDKHSAPYYYLTDLGKMYLIFKNEYISNSHKDFWLRVIPIVISAIALVVSIIALYRS